MKVKDLLKQFTKGDLEKDLIMFSDEEGNSYSDDIRIEEEAGTGRLIIVPLNSKLMDDGIYEQTPEVVEIKLKPVKDWTDEDKAKKPVVLR